MPEYEDVLKRPELNLKLTKNDIDKLLDIICFIGQKQPVFYRWRPLLKDEKDDFVGELALNSKADAIITHNIKDFQNIKKFGVKILTPQEFLVLLGEIK